MTFDAEKVEPDRFIWAFLGFCLGSTVAQGVLWVSAVVLLLMWAVRRKER